MVTTIQKQINETLFQKDILQALLVNSIVDENSKLPTIEQFILSEVVNGTIDYAGGKGGEIRYRRIGHEDAFERLLWKEYEKRIKGIKKKVAPKIESTITNMVKYYYIDPTGPARPYPRTKLYHCFEAYVERLAYHSTSPLMERQILKVKEEIMPSLSESEQKSIIGISEEMRKYVEGDLKFIGKRYHW